MIYEQIQTREPVDKGWSGDRKYRVTTENGEKYLLRVTAPEKAEHFRLCYRRTEKVAKLGIPMCLPLESGESTEGTYAIFTWVEGEDGESVIPDLPAERQYAYGVDAGRILKKLHSLPAPAEAPAWPERFNAKIDRKIAMYENCVLKYEEDRPFLDYIAEKRHLLSHRPQTYQHGDYHIGNMMIDRKGVLTVIDFDRDDFGDPWEEFNRIVWCAQSAPDFASGMVDGYFDGEVPMEFWELLALYICSNTLGSLPWAIPFGEEEVATMRSQAREILEWYDGMRSALPAWYRNRD